MAQILSLIFLFLVFACSAASTRTLFKPPVPPWKKLEEDEKEQIKKNEMMKVAVVKVVIDTLYAVPLALNAGLGEFSTGVSHWSLTRMYLSTKITGYACGAMQ